MSVGPIPWSKIIEYAVHEGYDAEAIDQFHYLIRKVDDEYLRLANEQPKGKGKGRKADPVNEVSPADIEGTRDIFRNLMLKQAASRPRRKLNSVS